MRGRRGPARFALWAVLAVGLALSGGGGAKGVVAGEPGGAEGPLWRVVLSEPETGAELWSAPARAGDVVAYAYTHSADKTPVESRLRVESPAEGFVVVEERYMWYGAGLEFRGDLGVSRDGPWVVVRVDRALPRLVLRVAGTVEQRLRVGNEETTLRALAPYGGRVMLEVKP